MSIDYKAEGWTETEISREEFYKTDSAPEGPHLRVVRLYDAMEAGDTYTRLDPPEPEWVEGAWYWATANGSETRPLKRLPKGWTCYDGDVSWFPDDQVTVLGRVLIVDWPGDEWVQLLTDAYRLGVDWTGVDWECGLLQRLADAIRTQGGTR